MLKNKKMIDLTVELYHGFPGWYFHPDVVYADHHLWWMNQYKYDLPCKGFSTKLLMISDHIGTHMDAQRHFYPEGQTTAQVPLEKMIGDAAFLDVSFRGADRTITVADLEKAEKQSGEPIRKGDILIVKAWPGKWGEGENFNLADGFEPDTADWMLSKGISVLGVDLATLDQQDRANTTHCKLLGEAIPVIENLNNLEQIQQSRFTFIAFPLKLRDGTGSPVRAVALVD